MDMYLSAENFPVLRSLARVTHTLSAGNLWDVVTHHRHAAVSAAAALAKEAGVKIDLQYTPWGQDDSPFPKDAPPTHCGAEEAAELRMFTERLALVKTWVEAEGAEVGAVLIDNERWDWRRGFAPGEGAAWRAAVTRKNNLIYNATHGAFPSADVLLYDRGAVGRAASPSGWNTNGYVRCGPSRLAQPPREPARPRSRIARAAGRLPPRPLPSAPAQYTNAPDELGDAFALSLYTVAEIGYTREAFNRTVAHARSCGKATVTPWLALGCGYVRDTAWWHWDYKYNYPFGYSWMLGRELNIPWYGNRPTQFAEWSFAKEAVLYPSPFDPSCAAVSNSSWLACLNHFVMYVRGATGVKDLTPV